MLKLFETMVATLENGDDAVLVTILASSGSAPRGAGSKLLVLESGETLGTIGGGAVELTAVKQAMDVFRTRQSYVKGFALSPGEVEDIGMICGGSVTVYYQLLEHTDARVLEALRRAAELLRGDENAWLISRIEAGALTRIGLYGLSMEALAPMLKTRAVLVKGEPTYYAEPIVRAGRVYLFGGGHVGQALVPVLAKVGFRVTVYDSRERVARPETFPEAERVIHGEYARIGELVAITAEDYVVIMTPGHQGDYEVLRQALRTEATYVGCIGSRKKVAATRERLLAAGISQKDVERVHSPIGLDIGAETPEEIAISVAAEMIAHRAGRR